MSTHRTTEEFDTPLTAEQHERANGFIRTARDRVERAAHPDATTEERRGNSRLLLHDVAMFGSGVSARHRSQRMIHEEKIRELIAMEENIEEQICVERDTIERVLDVLVNGECSDEQRLMCRQVLAASRDSVDRLLLMGGRLADFKSERRRSLLALKT